MITNFREITYTKHEREIVKQGIDAIKNVLIYGNEEEKASLIFCLDYYFDPFYCPDFPLKEKIIELLQEIFLQETNSTIQNDILDFLEHYCNQRLLIFENNIKKLDEEVLKNYKEYTIFLTRKHYAIHTNFNAVKELLLEDSDWITQTNILQTFFNYLDNNEKINLPYKNEMREFLNKLLMEDLHPQEKNCIEEILPYLD